MSRKNGPSHVVVDGSNIATEGRSMPSLGQLSEAVGSFMEEYPDAAITVVVDATFGHRIDKSEVAEFEAGISNNELVAPPAGAVGRGDAFVLGIADKAGASVLSNDSFQEFHGEYEWLFDEGRLIGGKPVPHVGWVWVDRVPVRGPVSRKATRGAGGGSKRGGQGRSRRGSQKDESTVRTGSKEASEPMPTPKSPPPGKATGAGASGSSTKAKESDSAAAVAKAPKGGEPVNDLMPFLDFVEHHPVGTGVTGTVESYSSHGAYLRIGDTGVRGYIPLRLMADPPPRSAKKIMKLGESLAVVVVSFAAGRRSIDCALPDMATAAIEEAEAQADATEVPATSSSDASSPDATPTGDTASNEAGAATKRGASKRTTAKKSAAKKTTAKKATTKKAAAKKAAAKKSAAKKSATKKTPAKKSAAKKTPAKKSAAKKSATKKAAAPKSATKRTATKKSAAKRTARATAERPSTSESAQEQ